MSSFAAYFEKQGCNVVSQRFAEIERGVTERQDLREIEAAIQQLCMSPASPLYLYKVANPHAWPKFTI